MKNKPMAYFSIGSFASARRKTAVIAAQKSHTRFLRAGRSKGRSDMEEKMEKKTAIVTGASRGIGYAIARQLGLDGYQVVMLATGAKEKYAEAFEKLTEQDITWHYVQGSIDCAQDRRRLLDETLARFGRVDVLVNNAGVAPLERKDILEMSEESFDRVMGINTKGRCS